MTSIYSENTNPLLGNVVPHPEEGQDLFDTFEAVDLAPEAQGQSLAPEKSTERGEQPTNEQLSPARAITPDSWGSGTLDTRPGKNLLVTNGDSTEDSLRIAANASKGNGTLTDSVGANILFANSDTPQNTLQVKTSIQHDIERDIEDVTAAAIALETQLEQAGVLKSNAIKQSIQTMINACQELPDDMQQRIRTTINQEFKALWQQKRSISNLVQAGDNVVQVLKHATDLLLRLLGTDRALAFKFQDPEQGTVMMESLSAGWTPSYGETLPALSFGLKQAIDYQRQHVMALHNTDGWITSPHQKQVLDMFQVQSSLAVPIVLHTHSWGLLVVQQCQRSRQWTGFEATVLDEMAKILALRLQPLEFEHQQKQWSDQTQILTSIMNRIHQASDVGSVFRTTTHDLRKHLTCDRVAIYRFNPDWTGEFVAESVAPGWTPLMQEQIDNPVLKQNINECSVKDLVQHNPKVADTHLRQTNGGRFSRGETYRICTDIYEAGFTNCYIDMLERYQARAYVMVAIYEDDQLWGLLAIYQNSAPRQWTAVEVSMLNQVGAQLSIALQQVQYQEDMAQAIQREQGLARMISQIRQTADIETIFKTVTAETRHLLKCDRVGIYRFNPDWSGQFVAESVGAEWDSLLELQKQHPRLLENISDCSAKDLARGSGRVADTYLQATKGGQFSRGELYRVAADIYDAGFSPCYIEILELYQARGYVIVALYYENDLWGLLAAYQNSAPRQWKQEDVNLLVQISNQLGIALQQVKFINQIQQQSDQLNATAERTLAYNKLINRLGQQIVQQAKDGSPAEKLMRIAVLEVRRLLKTDRVAFYKFNPDWSGDFVLEDFDSQWIPLVGTELARIEDSHLQDTQGGRYRNNESIKVSDIYTQGYQDCHLELLEQWSVKAYMLVPIFLGNKLWGMLGAYHNRSTREWQDYELDLLTQVGMQVSIALQQAESTSVLQKQGQELAESAARDKADKESLQRQIMQMLVAVRPALDGDLTVRAPITEDAVGTVADAYNNTIQSLRQLVAQVKEAAHQVSQTSEGSQSAVAQMTAQTERELEEINQALTQIQAMVKGTRSVADSAEQVEVAVQQANQVVQSGNQAMNLTVGGIQQIRDTVAETSKKIKRLGESSQKISKVVSLISNFTTQTNLLAINAAIEATRAGEYGRGFAVVADEVRSLAQQSDDATTEIEQLVQEIQAEVSAVSSAMDTGIQEVVRGTDLVNQTRQSLTDIVQATAQISQLVEGITQATQAQKSQSESVIQIINRVTETANQTSAESAKISASFQNLLATSQTLQSNVDRFKVD